MLSLWTKISLQLILVYPIIIANVIKTEDSAEHSNNSGLYRSTDDVVILHHNNFDSHILKKNNAWAVQFYNSYCGHCRRFAPIWKSLARSITGWRDVINLGAIDCAHNDNYALCRQYEITYYPMIRYFPPNFQRGSSLELSKGRDAEATRHIIISQLQKDQLGGRGDKWPIIIPYRNSEWQNIWKGVPDTVKYKFYIFERNDSYIGSEIILDFRNETSMIIRRVISDHPLAKMYEGSGFPTIVAFDRQEVQTQLKITVPTRAGVIEVIKTFMKSKGLVIDSRIMSRQNSAEITANVITNSLLNTQMKDNVHQADLEAAVRYSLEHEVPSQHTITGVKLEALNNYLKALAMYLPLETVNSQFFSTLLTSLTGRTTITGEEFEKLTKQAKVEPVFTQKQWVNCRGSGSDYRGYPCGLWTLFHTLTVSYAAADEDSSVDDPKAMLAVMHGYVKNFFGCADCSEHFGTMAEELKLFDVASTKDAILWLWRAHNQVNKRLAGDITEDPAFPKVQYPSKIHCPQCRRAEDTWNDTEVLKYLRKKYSRSEIEYDSELSRNRVGKNGSLVSPERNVTDQQSSSWTWTDISICVVLYAISATILVLVCFQFVVKRSLKKKNNVQSFLKKV